MSNRALKTVRKPRFISLLMAAALLGSVVSAHAYTGEKLARDAKVTITEARAIALKAHPGKITDEELEKENGGSGLRYSFDIREGSHP